MRNFATLTELMPHQVDAVNKMIPTRIGALFMEQGTGKSRTAIELAKIRHKKIDHVVWFCPVSLKRTVYGEILKHTDFTTDEICVFDDKVTDSEFPNVPWYIIGIESMSTSVRTILTAKKIITDKTMVILDESTYCKNHYAKRSERITGFSKIARYRLMMTGTPLTQGVVDLFAQMEFLSQKILGYTSFYSFAANHLEYSEKFPGMITKAHNTEFLAAKIKPYVYQVTKDECLSLPDKHYNTRYCYLTEEQQEAYYSVKEDLLRTIQNDMLNSYEIFVTFTKLQQIVSGFWPRKRATRLLKHERLETLMSAINEFKPEKSVIWAKYHRDINQISYALKREYGKDSVAEFHGGITERKKNDELEKFRGNSRFLVATQSTGGHGLTLNEVTNVFFYNNGFKWSERAQAEDRCHRIGQSHEVLYTDIHCSGTIDDRIWRALVNKGSVVEEFRQEVQKVKKDRIREWVKSL